MSSARRVLGRFPARVLQSGLSDFLLRRLTQTFNPFPCSQMLSELLLPEPAVQHGLPGPGSGHSTGLLPPPAELWIRAGPVTVCPDYGIHKYAGVRVSFSSAPHPPGATHLTQNQHGLHTVFNDPQI